MKYHNYTWNTGHVSRHDTDVNLMPDIIPEVLRLITARRGPVPGTRWINYDLCLDGNMFGLSTADSNGCPLWYTFGWLDKIAAGTVREAAGKLKVEPSPELPERLAAPGLLTVLLPTVVYVNANKEEISMLADFAKTMYGVWALNFGVIK